MSGKTDPAEKRTMKLKISNISTFMTKIHQRSESPRQQVAGIEWYILAYAQVIDNVTYLSCFLEGKNASKWTAWVDVSFRIVKGGGEFGAEGSFRHLMGKEPLASVWGWKKFLTSMTLLDTVNGFVVDDSVEIVVDLSVTDVCGDSFNVLETAGLLAADVKLRVGDSVFYANKGYLSVMSSVFRDVFALSEAAEGKKETNELELKGVDASEFKDFLGVIYPTRYPITDTNVTSLLRIADRYDARSVVADCERRLYGSDNVLKLKISNISTFMTKIHQRSESPRQQVAGIEWYILAYAQVIDNVTYLSCFLEGKNASKWTAWVDVSFRIVKGGGGFGAEGSFRHLMGNEPLESALGWHKFLTSLTLLDTANGFVVDDSVEIRVDLSLTDVCGDSFHVLEIAGSLAADVKLRVGDSVFYANKGYLSVMSSVFRNMFALSEAAEGKKEMEEIELKDLDASEFKDFLGVIYPTRYPITDTNVTSLFRIADRYDAKTVVADCERHLFGSNNVPWFDKMKLAVDLNPRHLKDHLFLEMICEDIQTVDQNENMHQLVRDVLQALFDKYIRICHP